MSGKKFLSFFLGVALFGLSLSVLGQESSEFDSEGLRLRSGVYEIQSERGEIEVPRNFCFEDVELLSSEELKGCLQQFQRNYLNRLEVNQEDRESLTDKVIPRNYDNSIKTSVHGGSPGSQVMSAPQPIPPPKPALLH